MTALNCDTLLVSSQQSAIVEPTSQPSSKKRYQKIETLRAYQLSVEILRPLIANDKELIGNKDLLHEINSSKIDTLKYLGAGFYSFSLNRKKSYYDKARASLGGLVTIWHFHEESTPEFIKRIEEDLIPAYSALIRKLEKKIEKD